MSGEIETCARRVYELQREQDLKRQRSGAGRIPTWDELPESERCRLIVAYWRVHSQYETGRSEPTESKIS